MASTIAMNSPIAVVSTKHLMNRESTERHEEVAVMLTLVSDARDHS